jgi:antitoxin (DNA-binding transcriptional repressor) of toxin-antitoxin stability system
VPQLPVAARQPCRTRPSEHSKTTTRVALDTTRSSGHTRTMSEQTVAVSADELHAASEQAASWDGAVARAARGETVAVIAGGEHVADVVPSAELERLRETIEVLSDTDAVRALADIEPVVVGRETIRSLVAERGE